MAIAGLFILLVAIRLASWWAKTNRPELLRWNWLISAVAMLVAAGLMLFNWLERHRQLDLVLVALAVISVVMNVRDGVRMRRKPGTAPPTDVHSRACAGTPSDPPATP